MDITRITARWTGFSGAPGYSNFYFASGFLDGGVFRDEAVLLATRVRDAFDEITSILPNVVEISIDPEVRVIDSDTGMATDFSTIDPGGALSGTGGNQFAGPAGAVVTWRTSDLRNGRRIRGRTFLVPLAATSYQDDGTLEPTTINRLNDFGNALVGNALEGDLGVWSRPVDGAGGVFATVTGFTVPDMTAVLRSRRD